MKLHCIDGEGKQQLIGLFDFMPTLTECLLKENHPKVDEFVVQAYSKDENVLRKSIAMHEFQMQPHVGFEKKLLDFGGYLCQRRKAALVKYAGMIFYILPGSTAQKYLECIVIESSKKEALSKLEEASHASLVSSSSGKSGTQTVDSRPTSSTRTSSKSPGPVAVATASAASSSQRPTSFLEALLNKAESNKVKVHVPVVDPAVLELQKSVKTRFQLLGESLRARISAFDRDVDATCLRLEPMDKDDRYVVHDVVADFPELVSVGVGDFEDRHVVIHRKGFPPPDLESNKTRIEGGKIPSTFRKPKSSYIPMAPPPDAALIPTNQVKRDRRTIEEIEEEIRRKRQTLA